MTVGPTKLPFSWPWTTRERPSTTIVAPAASASSVMRSTRAFASGVITGGMSVLSSSPGPTTSFSASALIAARNGSCASPTVTATGTAMQRSPAEPKAPEATWLAANSMFASGITTAWLFAPPRAWTRLPAAEAVRWTCWAIGVEPTKETAATPSCSHSASTTLLPPWTTWKTPLGSPASR